MHENVRYTTFQQAARAIGLFTDEAEAKSAMEEAVASFYHPAQLRFLFAHLLPDIPMPVLNL